jgi:hypothetical protein
MTRSLACGFTDLSLEPGLQSFAFHLSAVRTGSDRDTMKQSEIFRENAENCAHLAESANSEPAYLRFKRMEAAWLALADEQDWLDGEVSPASTFPARKANGVRSPGRSGPTGVAQSRRG